MAPKSLEKSAERAEDCFADWEGAKATAEPAIRERRATVFMVDSSCFFDFVEIEANKRAGERRGSLVACRRKETKIEEVGKLHTKGGIGIHASKKGKQRHKLALPNSYEDACDVVFIFGS